MEPKPTVVHKVDTGTFSDTNGILETLVLNCTGFVNSIKARSLCFDSISYSGCIVILFGYKIIPDSWISVTPAVIFISSGWTFHPIFVCAQCAAVST